MTRRIVTLLGVSAVVLAVYELWMALPAWTGPDALFMLTKEPEGVRWLLADVSKMLLGIVGVGLLRRQRWARMAWLPVSLSAWLAAGTWNVLRSPVEAILLLRHGEWGLGLMALTDGLLPLFTLAGVWLLLSAEAKAVFVSHPIPNPRRLSHVG